MLAFFRKENVQFTTCRVRINLQLPISNLQLPTSNRNISAVPGKIYSPEIIIGEYEAGGINLRAIGGEVAHGGDAAVRFQIPGGAEMGELLQAGAIGIHE